MVERIRTLVGWSVLLLAGLLFPFFVGNDYHLTVMSTAYLFAIATLGLNLIVGYTGQFNLAHAGFMAIGAYTVGILITEGVPNGYMMSTFSLPEEVRKGGSKALYTCPGGATGGYAQCDGGTCFKSTTGKYFPGVGQLTADEIICSCPITKPTTADAPFGYQFIGPYPCQKKAFAYCTQNVQNGSIVPVGSPPGAGRTKSLSAFSAVTPASIVSAITFAPLANSTPAVSAMRRSRVETGIRSVPGS